MSTASKGNILLIDDDSEFRYIYADAIAADGYTVATAGDGEQGLSMTRENKPDLVLLDLILPRLPGFEVLKSIRANPETRDIIILISSVLGEHRHIQRAMELGANDYTVKGNYTPRDVLGKIDALLKKPDVKEHINAYNLFVKKNRGDAAKLQEDAGSPGIFTCTACKEEMQLVLTPDHSHHDAHRFSAHFACPGCGRSF